MDTIIDLCRMAGNTPERTVGAERPYEIRTYQIQDYRLIRAELWGTFWDELVSDGKDPGRKRDFLRFFRRERRKQDSLSTGIFKRELASLLDERDNIYCVTERADVWERQRILQLPEFDGYAERKWVQRLLPYAVYPHFVAIGAVSYLPELFCGIAPRMKSLTWIVPEAFRTDETEDFAEDFYREYGLAVNMRFTGAEDSAAQSGTAYHLPQEAVSILDFTQGRRTSVAAAVPEGVWLDVAASAEKERRIEAREMKVSYISLRKLWRRPENELFRLDTIRKNRYNT